MKNISQGPFLRAVMASGALHSTWSTVADSLAGSEAQLVRDLNEKWFSVSGTFSLVTEFVISYKANATYTGNNAGLLMNCFCCITTVFTAFCFLS